MKKKLTRELLKDLKKQGYTALICAGQMGKDELLYTLSKEPFETVIDNANHTPFEEDDIILLDDSTIASIPEDHFEGKEVEI